MGRGYFIFNFFSIFRAGSIPQNTGGYGIRKTRADMESAPTTHFFHCTGRFYICPGAGIIFNSILNFRAGSFPQNTGGYGFRPYAFFPVRADSISARCSFSPYPPNPSTLISPLISFGKRVSRVVFSVSICSLLFIILLYIGSIISFQVFNTLSVGNSNFKFPNTVRLTLA
jgi:hypothetical protein